MPFSEWDRNPAPCKTCLHIYDDEHGRLKDQMIPCLQAQKAAATGQTAILAFHRSNIGWPCPFACSLGDLYPLAASYQSAVMNQKAREIMDRFAAHVQKSGVPRAGFFMTPIVAITEKDFDIYDPRSYLVRSGTVFRNGEYVVLKGQRGSALWDTFKPWYMANVSSTLNGWTTSDKFFRMLDLALGKVGAEAQGILVELRKPANAAKFAAFLIFVMALNTNAIGRVLAYLLGTYLTLDMIAVLAKLLSQASTQFFAADTEGGLDAAAASLAKFFAQIIVFVGMALAAAALGALVRGVLKNSRKNLEVASKKEHPTAEEAPTPEAPAPAAVASPRGASLWSTRIKPRAQRVADKLRGEPFFDLPSNLRTMKPRDLREWLDRHGFSCVKPAERFQKSDGTYDWKSEVWYRVRPDMKARGKIEAVRVDEHGHNVNPNFAGAKPHAHADLIDYADAQLYLNEYIPELPAPFRAGGQPVPKYQNPGDFVTAGGKPTNPTYFQDTHNPINQRR